MSQHPPERVRVTGPRRRTGRARNLSVASEIDAQTTLGELYMRSLMRSQLRLALEVAAALALTVGMLPLLFRLIPASRRLAVAGVPLPWLLLGLVVYPFMILLAWLYVRRTERNEHDFTVLVDQE